MQTETYYNIIILLATHITTTITKYLSLIIKLLNHKHKLKEKHRDHPVTGSSQYIIFNVFIILQKLSTIFTKVEQPISVSMQTETYYNIIILLATHIITTITITKYLSFIIKLLNQNQINQKVRGNKLSVGAINTITIPDNTLLVLTVITM